LPNNVYRPTQLAKQCLPSNTTYQTMSTVQHNLPNNVYRPTQLAKQCLQSNRTCQIMSCCANPRRITTIRPPFIKLFQFYLFFRLTRILITKTNTGLNKIFFASNPEHIPTLTKLVCHSKTINSRKLKPET